MELAYKAEDAEADEVGYKPARRAVDTPYMYHLASGEPQIKNVSPHKDAARQLAQKPTSDPRTETKACSSKPLFVGYMEIGMLSNPIYLDM